MKREGAEDNTLYLLAAACLHEFNEVTLSAVHMYGTGALKLVRPLYERVVTLSYLEKPRRGPAVHRLFRRPLEQTA